MSPEGGLKATTFVQIIVECPLLVGNTFIALVVLWHFDFNRTVGFLWSVARLGDEGSAHSH